MTIQFNMHIHLEDFTNCRKIEIQYTNVREFITMTIGMLSYVYFLGCVLHS